MDQDRRDIYRESIEFMCVEQYGSVVEKRGFFYDKIVSYAPYTGPRPPSYKEYDAAQSIVTLRSKIDDGLFADKSFYTIHSEDELKAMFKRAEKNIAMRKPAELKEAGSIRLDFLRASIPLTTTDQPLSGPEKMTQHVFFDQIVGHGAYTYTTQYYAVPFAKSFVILKNNGCFGSRKVYITETQDQLLTLFDKAEEEMGKKAVKLLSQLKL